MTASEFINLAQKALLAFEHKNATSCDGEPVIATKPVTGEIAIVCKTCHNGIVITKLEAANAPEKPAIIAPEMDVFPLSKPKPRFKL